MTQYEQCPQLRDLSPNIQQFWEEKQQECGEQLVMFSYAIFLGTPETSSPEKSGILYLMERNLWFEDFPKPPIFLLTRSTTYKKTLLQIPRESITKVELVKKSGVDGRLQRKMPRNGRLQKLFSLFRAEPVYLHLVREQEGVDSMTYNFRELNDPEAWKQGLQKP